MIENILTSDGSHKEFAAFKIENALKNAFKSENTTYDSSIFCNVLEKLKNKRVVVVEDIQDLIETQLYKGRYFEVMRSFILYRHMHKMQRDNLIEIGRAHV